MAPVITCTSAGPSPRVRGTPSKPPDVVGTVGIIPARAGNTIARSASGWCSWDHPRVCGKHQAGISATQKALESSPRVRGTLERRRWRQLRHGIIPACAGNTRPSCERGFTARDHPRVRGEHVTVYAWGAPRALLAVQLDVARHRVRVGSALPGIIPARAGNTSSRFRRSPARRDHPRACGEHVELCKAQRLNPGSSPRVRGTLL